MQLLFQLRLRLRRELRRQLAANVEGFSVFGGWDFGALRAQVSIGLCRFRGLQGSKV